ncbi:ATP-binding cassette domain-containing protein [Natranaerobius thermophilus]|uniref:ABC transporter related n=1 Tax=Natranaerobius thermophilus (strain ATCC BAA-1301 / DSM 18059 / JW/NM-WN-LF) TaxID=457570 RepID=B2A8G8_NATTJ|nr:ATP-binding cassette domain-containing protein [Natranaerobius thermophilus]ACB85852.1 ABC transporter related [Natranaerobius thermophilus JW/NM-WN-LF]
MGDKKIEINEYSSENLTSLYRLKNVIKQESGQTILSVPDLTLKEGEVYGIIGPSGAGKSTLVRILNGLSQPTSGEVYFLNKELFNKKNLRQLQKEMTLVFQKPHLFNTTVLENVAYGLKVRGYPSKKAFKIAENSLKEMGILELKKRKAASLSGGEAQRVALARAMAFKPRVLLLDEPTGNLDPGNIKLIENKVNSLYSQEHTTVIMVTHNMFQAKRIATRGMFIYQGKLIEEGPIDQIFSEPESNLTKQFVNGEMIF